MRAVFYTAQGSAAKVLQVGDQPTPLPGPGEVRVRLRTSGVNPSDVKSRGGSAGWPMLSSLIIPHSDGAGDIDSVGDGVAASRIGERVWIWNGQYKRPFGTAAEYIAVPSAQAVKLPNNVSYHEGACLGIPALTASHAIERAGVVRGMTVLVSGGAGAVGHCAIQIAKQKGARVLTTVSSDEKAAHASVAGADQTINYKIEKVADRVKSLTDGQGVDALIELDLSANAGLLTQVLRPHGIASIYGMTDSEVMLNARALLRNSITLRFFLIYDLSAADRVEAVAEVSRMMSEGCLQNSVFQSFALERAVEAHELVESGRTLGNVVIEI